jgi:hypothetical protein
MWCSRSFFVVIFGALSWFVTLPTSAFGTPRLLLWRFMVFQTRILPGVSWIGSPLLGLASFWVLLWCLGLPANSRVLLNPLPR